MNSDPICPGEGAPGRQIGARTFAVLVQFENCLCREISHTKQNKTAQFSGGENTALEAHPFSHEFYSKDTFSPIEFASNTQLALQQLSWEKGAVWFLKSIGRDSGAALFVISCYPEEVVRQKLARISIRGDVVGSTIEYDPVSGLYHVRRRMDESARAALVLTIRESNVFEQIVCLSREEQDWADVPEVTTVLIGRTPHSAGAGQFASRNFIEAFSVVKSALGRHEGGEEV